MIEGISDVNSINSDFIFQKLPQNNINNVKKELIENNLFDKAHNKVYGELRIKFCRNKYYKKENE